MHLGLWHTTTSSSRQGAHRSSFFAVSIGRKDPEELLQPQKPGPHKVAVAGGLQHVCNPDAACESLQGGLHSARSDDGPDHAGLTLLMRDSSSTALHQPTCS